MPSHTTLGRCLRSSLYEILFLQRQSKYSACVLNIACENTLLRVRLYLFEG